MGKQRDTLNLYSFFKFGHIGEIHAGMPVEKLLKKLDRRRLSKKYPLSEELSYSYFYRYHIELLVNEEQLYMIIVKINLWNPTIDFFVGDEKGQTPMDRNITLEDFTACLGRYNIKWTFQQRYCFDQQLVVRTEGGVAVIFGFDGEPPYLERMVKTDSAREVV